MIMRFPTMRLVAQMVMMPRQYESINNGLGHEVKQLGMNRFDLLKRDQEIIKMRPNRFENVRQLGILNLFDQAEDSHQLWAHPCNGTKATEVRTEVKRF